MQGFVAYYRVTTDRQGSPASGSRPSGRQSPASRRPRLQIAAEFTEVESGKGTTGPSWPSARACRRTGAILMIAKLDRLARNVAFMPT